MGPGKDTHGTLGGPNQQFSTADSADTSQTPGYSRSSRPHVRMSKKSEHEQEASNESSMCDKMVCWCDTQNKEKSQELDAWWFDPC